MLATIRAAIDANRIDLYLQPIVTLPQRKVRYYEAMTRLRTDRGEVLQPADFIAQAEAAGLMPRIDNLVVFRCVQVVRRLLLKNREIGLFCNLSGSTLNDAQVFPQLLEFLDANRAIAPSVVLEFTQAALRAAGPIETESLAALAERGFRFSLDNVTDMRIEPRELATRGFRFIKIPANLMLNRANASAIDIHPADLSDLLGRFGVDLIAEKIESEGAVVDLLDYDVRYGQGFLFSPPRPVRAEALQGIAERSDVVARDNPAAGGNAGAGPGDGGSSGLRRAEGLPSGEGGEIKRGIAQLARRV
jgi:cyclic-di-GMP phosphodiesterase TipF (flagellum assembly factor)